MRADNDMDVIEQALKTHFGHETFRSGQRHIVDMVLAGRDTLVAQIATRGLDPLTRETYANGARKITYRDPDGNEIGFGGAPR